MKTLFAIIAAATLFTAPVHAEAVHFERDGMSYQANVKRVSDALVITGRNLTEQQDFSMRIRNGVARGFYGRSRVSFPVKGDGAALFAQR